MEYHIVVVIAPTSITHSQISNNEWPLTQGDHCHWSSLLIMMGYPVDSYHKFTKNKIKKCIYITIF